LVATKNFPGTKTFPYTKENFFSFQNVFKKLKTRKLIDQERKNKKLKELFLTIFMFKSKNFIY
jgi:hypothetical protein